VLLALPICLLISPSYPSAPVTAVQNPPEVVDPSKAHRDPTLPDPATEPVAFLKACLARYDARGIETYTLDFHKQERVQNKLLAYEVVHVCYREKPYSVYFHWIQPPKRTVRSTLYVEGENKGPDSKSMLKVYINIGIKIDRAPDSADAMEYSRYPMNTFGLKQAMQRVYDSWVAAAKAKALHVQYLGQVKLEGRECYKFERTRYASPEEDGVTGLVIYIDCETLLQVGSIVRGGPDGSLLGEYFFRDIRLNPNLPAWQFTPEAFGKD
jgi:hypothetical protein